MNVFHVISTQEKPRVPVKPQTAMNRLESADLQPSPRNPLPHTVLTRAESAPASPSSPTRNESAAESASSAVDPPATEAETEPEPHGEEAADPPANRGLMSVRFVNSLDDRQSKLNHLAQELSAVKRLNELTTGSPVPPEPQPESQPEPHPETKPEAAPEPPPESQPKSPVETQPAQTTPVLTLV